MSKLNVDQKTMSDLLSDKKADFLIRQEPDQTEKLIA